MAGLLSNKMADLFIKWRIYLAIGRPVHKMADLLSNKMADQFPKWWNLLLVLNGRPLSLHLALIIPF